MFFGEFDHSLDKKNRFILPSRFRDVFKKNEKQNFYMTRGFDECLALYLEQDWKTEITYRKTTGYIYDIRFTVSICTIKFFYHSINYCSSCFKKDKNAYPFFCCKNESNN